MHIHDLGKYRINYKFKMTYNLPTHDEPNNWRTEVTRKQRTVNGDELLTLIRVWLDLPNKSNLCEVRIDDDTVWIEEFNPYTGETQEWLYKIRKNLSRPKTGEVGSKTFTSFGFLLQLGAAHMCVISESLTKAHSGNCYGKLLLRASEGIRIRVTLNLLKICRILKVYNYSVKNIVQ